MHLMLRPGTDGALASAVMHVLFRDGFADRSYMEKYTDVPEELEQHLRTRTPEWAAAITGLDPQQIVRFAHLYGGTTRSFLGLATGLRVRAMAPPTCTRCLACRRSAAPGNIRVAARSTAMVGFIRSTAP